MKICYENTIPVTPRGAGTGLAGGAVPLLGGVLMDTSKMNRILSYDMENFVVEIESGVLLNDLANDCISKGMMYPRIRAKNLPVLAETYLRTQVA